MPTSASREVHLGWRLLRAVVPPLLLCALVVLALWEPIGWWLAGEEIYDQEAIKEWVREARVFNTLPELIEQYLELEERYRQLRARPKVHRAEREALEHRRDVKREEIQEHLKALGNPPTKIYPGQLPLFPIIYRIEVAFDDALGLAPISWESEVPRHRSQFRELPPVPVADGAHVGVEYRLHAYLQRQFKERQETTRRLWLSGLGLVFAVGALLWIYIGQRRERQRKQQRLVAEQQVSEAERLRLEEELRRQDAESKHAEAERQNLELKSQLFANIGIMAGSYAHNIKNLLVRPNDLLRRCLEEAGDGQADMLREVKQTLGTVTERLQQILQTVRRDPSKSEMVRIDLNALARDMQATWALLAQSKWKLDLEFEQVQGDEAQLWIEGDLSHLQQALENLLFNARDATFEMRNRLRERARQGRSSDESSVSTEKAVVDPERRQAMIAAAGWRGRVTIRTRRRGTEAILEVADNGIGMTEEVRQRCIETHFSTKRDNALFAGMSAGMGLGLSFVTVILEHHRATLTITSQPNQGTTFQVHFPLASVDERAKA